MDRYLRVFRFTGQLIAMGFRKPLLLTPIVANFAFAAPINMGLAIALGLVESRASSYALTVLGVGTLYFLDYFANGLTASLIHDEVVEGDADLHAALRRTARVSGSIALFAAISALFDLLQAYANERDDLLSRYATRILYLLWSTATYVVMPALVLESSSFGQAFARSRELAQRDPTQAGIGVVGIGALNYVLGTAIFALAYKLSAALAGAHPILAGALFFSLINAYWALSGYVKISYFTCFYLWARACERTGTTSPGLAPAPLSAVLT